MSGWKRKRVVCVLEREREHVVLPPPPPPHPPPLMMHDGWIACYPTLSTFGLIKKNARAKECIHSSDRTAGHARPSLPLA